MVRALALRQLDRSLSDPKSDRWLAFAGKTVRQIEHSFQDGGLEWVLFEALRPDIAPVLNLEQSSRWSRWFVPRSGRLCAVYDKILSQIIVRSKGAASIGRETIRI